MSGLSGLQMNLRKSASMLILVLSNCKWESRMTMTSHPMLIFAIPPVSARHTRPGFLCKFVTILQAEQKQAGTFVQPTNFIESYGSL